MKIKSFSKKLSHYLILTCSLLTIPLNAEATATTLLADQPVMVSGNVPGNVALALSVEYPTAVGDAYPPADISYKVTDTYLGYFDPAKCYDYHTDESISNHYFVPVSTTADHTCSRRSRHWSGNFLNWALTQTIDPLRQALTGGYRSIDTESLTVLEKAYASTSQGSKGIIKTITGDTVSGATPYTWPKFNLMISRQGNSFVFSNASYIGSVQLSDALPEVPSDSSAVDIADSKMYRMYARVQVCASKALKEANCTQYPDGPLKPTGLIQNNATKLNFAAIAYLYDSTFKRDGGVLRARMAQLGPTVAVPGAVDIKNPNPEWDEKTGVFFQNPDKEDASDTGVSNSGVINYLNKFGLNAQGYKSADNVSELYYTAIRYFKNAKNAKNPGGGNVNSYSNNLTKEMADGFPVITKWDDPIKYACQPNFIIGVGDSATRLDGNLPGSTRRGAEEPDPPQEVLDDKTVNVATVTNNLGALEGLKNLGNMFIPWGITNGDPLSEGTGGTFYIAGLAYAAHTKDIRHDLDGLQTISTYWLDVLQKPSLDNNKKPIGTADRHNFGGVTGMWNQYWLAAKYGGFTVPKGFDSDTATTPLTTDLWDTSGGANGGADGDPDHYFRANNPALMIENLNKAFSSILSVPSGFSGNFNLKSLSVKSDDLSYGTSYSSKSWTGDVTASTASDVESTPLWSAAKILESQDWNTRRYIATSVSSNCVDQPHCGRPFRLSGLSNANKANLGEKDPESLVNFLRGDRSNDGSINKDNAAYRKRAQILGDIVNSKIFVNGAPNAGYSDSYNPGYSTFKEANASRQTVLYVGANDGMLHAFNGAKNGGNELFAYVPQALFAGPNNTPTIDGLAALASPDYVHHYYVDASPVVVDVDFNSPGGTSDWHSLLVSGLGKGGKSYFAIDVTHPESLSNEGQLASAIKWEFSDPRMGYTYGKPVIVKTERDGWVVILTSGYNNGGQAYFFILKASTGKLLQAIKVGAENKSNDPGLASAAAYVNDYRDYTADAVYAGDLLGNVWRLDLTGKANDYPAPIKIAELISPTGSPQPITVAPRIEIDRSTSKRYVFVGTGRFLDSSDVANTQGQTFYAIHDGTNSAFFTTSTAPIAFPFKRESMENNTNLKTGIAVDSDSKTGWYVDLGWGANGAGYRIDQDLNSGAGVIAFVANLTTGDACQLSGTHDLYALTYGTGKSVLLDNGAVVTKFHDLPGLGASPTLYKSTDGLKIGDSSKTTEKVKNRVIDTNNSIAAGFKILNWRGIPNGN